MPYDITLSEKIRDYLIRFPGLQVEEKQIFGGLAFIVNNKMCVNVSGDNLMCRFDPALHEEVAEKNGFQPMIMKGKELKGYCYINPAGFRSKKDFEYFLDLCLDFNARAKSSKKKKQK